ncbi:MAG: radical SAM protein [Candidatus Limivivens sp.]|nr:radical SAM protein [Candidatus Limivivens sp.]
MRSSIAEENLRFHPCFQESCHSAYGRIHLPVAPRCNIQCAFCDRKYDCVNESRPGVTSKVITAAEAAERVREAVRREPGIRVAGIAGPGDPLANPETFETLRLLRKSNPGLILCASTNGLLLTEKLEELLDAGLNTLTVTINAATLQTAARIYTAVQLPGGEGSGARALEQFLELQREGLTKSCEAGLTVKVNTILIPGINDGEISAVARLASEAGASVMNLMPLIPCGGMKERRAPSGEELAAARQDAGRWIRQFTLCRQCRADACGFV